MRNATLPRLLRLSARHPVTLLAAFVSAVTGSVATALAPLQVKAAIDAIGRADAAALPPILATLAVLYALGSLFTWLTALCANLVAVRTVRELRAALFGKLGRVPLRFYDTQPHGDVMTRFTADLDAVADGLGQGAVQLFSGTVTLISTVVLMCTLDTAVTLVAVLTTPLCFAVGYVITRTGRRRFREQSDIQGQLAALTEEMFSGTDTVKAFGYEPAAADRFDAVNAALYESGYRAQFASALVNPCTRFVNNTAYVLVGVCGVYRALSAGTIAGFLTYTAQFAKPVNEITGIVMQLQMALASARRVFQLLDMPEQPPDGADALPLTAPGGALAFEQVRFAYDPARPLITGFSLRVNPGDTVAIVGPTGAGKTTLVNLLMRFYDPDGGDILLQDGGSWRKTVELPRDSLRRAFGMVLQETWLFAGTVWDNLIYGKPDATEEEVVAAAKAAHAHSFIRRLPEGYRTVITEDGGNLSQGQKQLLTIARVMLADCPMLILDEATSAVDVVTEQRIQRALRKMMRGKTAFVIAHRLSTVRDADTIVVLNAGNVIEQGTHGELLARGGFYSRLYRAQFEPEE